MSATHKITATTTIGTRKQPVELGAQSGSLFVLLNVKYLSNKYFKTRLSSTRFCNLWVQGPCLSHLCASGAWHTVDVQCMFVKYINKGTSEYMNVEWEFLLEEKEPIVDIITRQSNPGGTSFKNGMFGGSYLSLLNLSFHGRKKWTNNISTTGINELVL